MFLGLREHGVRSNPRGIKIKGIPKLGPPSLLTRRNLER